ncbi:uncharacterized protein [Diadema setosum]|uniref:uncharacterized protein n=1 Tax=Diadema setosum TaxID=31175 RepID=UPI003B3B98D2
MDLSEYIELGEKYGLQGEKLLTFAREERDKEVSRREANAARDERQKQREEQLKLAEEATKQKQLELEIAECNKDRYSLSSDYDSQGFQSALPRMQAFNENSDDLDAYILRFERHATLSKWPKGAWAPALGNLLTGRALECYTRLPTSEAEHYDSLKHALLQHFALNAEGFRKRFREAKQKDGESFAQFAARVSGYAKSWVERSECSDSAEALLDLCVQEQLFASCTRELAIFIRERTPGSVQDFVKHAELYFEARGLSDQKSQAAFRANQPKGPRCHSCGRWGHIAPKCPTKGEVATKYPPKQPTSGKAKTGGSCLTGLCPDAPASEVESGKADAIRTAKLICGHELLVLNSGHELGPDNVPTCQGRVNGKRVTVLRDTGCNAIVVRRSLVGYSQMSGELQPCVLMDGTIRRFPLAFVDIHTPYLSGNVKALCMDNPVYDLIVGNVNGVQMPVGVEGRTEEASGSYGETASEVDMEMHGRGVDMETQTDAGSDGGAKGTGIVAERREETTDATHNTGIGASVETRGMRRRKEQPWRRLKMPDGIEIAATRDEMLREQEGDVTLEKVKRLAVSGENKIVGRVVRGPMTILRELWTEEIPEEEVKTTYQYVLDLRDRLQSTCEVARSVLEKSSLRYKKHFDVRARERRFEKGDKALLLLPTSSNKLEMQWQGPFEVVGRVARHNYKLRVKGKEKTYHANLMKKYQERAREESVREANHLRVIDEQGSEDEAVSIECPSVVQTEGVSDVHISDELSNAERKELVGLVKGFADVMTDVPGHTNLAQHTVQLKTEEPIRSRPFPVPQSMRETIQEEVNTMLDMKVIEPSMSPYAAPVVLVPKKDGKVRFCVDYRKLNSVTVIDNEPIPNVEEIMSEIGEAKYFSKIDLSKGYWQIPVDERDREKTAFVTPEGQYQFRVLPFGMVNAPAVFTRMMRKLLAGLPHVVHYIDDVLVYSKTWEEHVDDLRRVFQRLREAHLTARPSKCHLGCRSVEFLGHIVEGGRVKPTPEKLAKVKSMPRPTTKREVRSFLGLVGYYRKFIPNMAAIAAPLTDLTKKNQPEKVRWGEVQEHAFQTLQDRLCKYPILRLPNRDEEYVVRTDASDIGIGAVLMQKQDSDLFPVSYASRKLLDRERKYAIVERECLALAWAVKKFSYYLYGRKFTYQTDHYPLAYLSKAQHKNARVLRWALALQAYDYRVQVIKGSENDNFPRAITHQININRVINPSRTLPPILIAYNYLRISNYLPSRSIHQDNSTSGTLNPRPKTTTQRQFCLG